MEHKHIDSSFDNDLNKINNNLLKLGTLGLDQFEKCINNFGTQNLKEIDKVIAFDQKLDELDEKIQKSGFEIIALRSPRAIDLRRVIVALKISTILERIGDYSRNISNRTKVLIELNYTDLPGVNIGKMGQKTQQMFEDVLESYTNEDYKLAIKVRNSDFKIESCSRCSLRRRSPRSRTRPRTSSTRGQEESLLATIKYRASENQTEQTKLRGGPFLYFLISSLFLRFSRKKTCIFCGLNLISLKYMIFFI